MAGAPVWRPGLLAVFADVLGKDKPADANPIAAAGDRPVLLS